MAAPPQPTAVGDVTGLCILVQFPDVPGTITRQQVDNFCNQVGYSGFGNNGSVRDYFLEISEGKLRYRNVVTAYYTAQQNRAYYTNPAIPFGSRARELITEALTNLRNNGFDFSQLSADSGGFVYALNVFYAGDARQLLEPGTLAAPVGPVAGLRGVADEDVPRLPDHEHGCPAHAAHVLPRERAHGL